MQRTFDIVNRGKFPVRPALSFSKKFSTTLRRTIFSWVDDPARLSVSEIPLVQYRSSFSFVAPVEGADNCRVLVLEAVGLTPAYITPRNVRIVFSRIHRLYA